MTLDLKDLERKLDKALAKETPESIAKWLKEERSGLKPLTKD